MDKPRKRGRRVLYVLGIPAALSAAGFAYVADNHLAAALMGAIVGFVIGIAILAFPNLDRGGPADTDSMLN